MGGGDSRRGCSEEEEASRAGEREKGRACEGGDIAQARVVEGGAWVEEVSCKYELKRGEARGGRGGGSSAKRIESEVGRVRPHQEYTTPQLRVR